MKTLIRNFIPFIVIFLIAIACGSNKKDSTNYKKVEKKQTQTETKKKYGQRIGARCCDGTRSSATGSGACSHHGGVCEWLYSE